MRAPNTPSLKPSQSKAPQEHARQNIAEAHKCLTSQRGRSKSPHQTKHPINTAPRSGTDADIALTRRAQRAPSSPLITKRPRISARLTALSSNQFSARTSNAPYHLGESTRTAVTLGWGLVTPAATHSTTSDRRTKIPGVSRITSK